MIKLKNTLIQKIFFESVSFLEHGKGHSESLKPSKSGKSIYFLFKIKRNKNNIIFLP